MRYRDEEGILMVTNMPAARAIDCNMSNQAGSPGIEERQMSIIEQQQ